MYIIIDISNGFEPVLDWKENYILEFNTIAKAEVYADDNLQPKQYRIYNEIETSEEK